MADLTLLLLVAGSPPPPPPRQRRARPTARVIARLRAFAGRLALTAKQADNIRLPCC